MIRARFLLVGVGLAILGLYGAARSQAPGGPAGIPQLPPQQKPAPQRFQDISGPAGVFVHVPNGPHGAGMVDVDGDGRLDFFVANLYSPNWLFLNLGNATFLDRGVVAGIAEVIKGSHSAAFFDMEGDGDYDALIGNMSGEGHMAFAEESIDTVWRNNGKGQYEDVADASGFGVGASVGRSAFRFAIPGRRS